MRAEVEARYVANVAFEGRDTSAPIRKDNRFVPVKEVARGIRADISEICGEESVSQGVYSGAWPRRQY